jgi:hypothetical protein
MAIVNQFRHKEVAATAMINGQAVAEKPHVMVYNLSANVTIKCLKTFFKNVRYVKLIRRPNGPAAKVTFYKHEDAVNALTQFHQIKSLCGDAIVIKMGKPKAMLSSKSKRQRPQVTRHENLNGSDNKKRKRFLDNDNHQSVLEQTECGSDSNNENIKKRRPQVTRHESFGGSKSNKNKKRKRPLDQDDTNSDGCQQKCDSESKRPNKKQKPQVKGEKMPLNKNLSGSELDKLLAEYIDNPKSDDVNSKSNNSESVTGSQIEELTKAIKSLTL